MKYELWSRRGSNEDDGCYPEILLRSWNSNSLECVKTEAELLIHMWDKELANYLIQGNSRYENYFFESKVIPGFEEGDTIIIKSDGKSLCKYTYRWEVCSEQEGTELCGALV